MALTPIWGAVSADYRSMIIRGQRLASRSVSIAIGMLTPGFFGYWLDTRLGTEPALLMVGFTAGFAYGLWRLILLGRNSSQPEAAAGEPAAPTLPTSPPATPSDSLADSSVDSMEGPPSAPLG